MREDDIMDIVINQVLNRFSDITKKDMDLYIDKILSEIEKSSVVS